MFLHPELRGEQLVADYTGEDGPGDVQVQGVDGVMGEKVFCQLVLPTVPLHNNH